MPERVACSVRVGRPDRVGWRGQGIVHGRSRSGVARGIGHGGQHEAGGEVTGPEVVGAGPACVGVHCRHAGILERRRGNRCVAAVWGRGEWPTGTALADRG
jgi:hypothetical protein